MTKESEGSFLCSKAEKKDNYVIHTLESLRPKCRGGGNYLGVANLRISNAKSTKYLNNILPYSFNISFLLQIIQELFHGKVKALCIGSPIFNIEFHCFYILLYYFRLLPKFLKVLFISLSLLWNFFNFTAGFSFFRDQTGFISLQFVFIYHLVLELWTTLADFANPMLDFWLFVISNYLIRFWKMN